MEWTELHDLNLCEEDLVFEPWKHPYRSKERGDLWNDIAANLNASGHLKFKVSQPSGWTFGWNQGKECWETRRTSPDGEERKKMDVGRGGISERKVRKRECAEKDGFGVETKGADSKGGYDENTSTQNITDSALRENENKTSKSLYTNWFTGQMPNEIKRSLETLWNLERSGYSW